MNIARLLAELVSIQQNPVAASVNINVGGQTTTYTFLDHYYYPAGIAQISIVRGGANVVYVYTTANSQYPHLTIPDTGQGLHWTTAAGNNNYDAATWPAAISNLIGQFPDA